MGRRIVLLVTAIGLFGCIVGSAAVYAWLWNGRSLPPTVLAEAKQIATAVTDPSTNQSAHNDLSVALLTTPRAVPFPDGSLDHSFFALTGGHQSAKCAACHTTGDYQGTSPDCLACHAQDDPHAGEFGLACANCHVVEGWQLATFDHATIGNADCSTCHAPPANHYQGACAACHTDTTDFRIIANFDHSTIGSTDCSACHAPPANHFPGSCRNCHGDVNNFRNVTFNHAGLTDCQSCHASPANHFPGQCSACHTTTSWQGASFNHTFPINHEGANGNCATCHPGGDTAVYTCTACHNQQEMNEEHDEESGYTGNNCVQCHADGREHEDDDDGGGDDDDD